MPEESEQVEEVSEEIAEEIAEVIEDEISDADVDLDVDIDVIEAPDFPETASVDVGDLHISGPPELVENITTRYLKDHIDHNPHGEVHTPDIPEMLEPDSDGIVEDIGQAITPDIVEEQISQSVAGETVDNPPEPTDWLFRQLGGR